MARRRGFTSCTAATCKRTGERRFHESPHPSAFGNVDMLEVMRALRDVGFTGPMRPDHGRMIWGETGTSGVRPLRSSARGDVPPGALGSGHRFVNERAVGGVEIVNPKRGSRTAQTSSASSMSGSRSYRIHKARRGLARLNDFAAECRNFEGDFHLPTTNGRTANHTRPARRHARARGAHHARAARQGARRSRSRAGTRVGYNLVKLGFIQEIELTKMLARQYQDAGGRPLAIRSRSRNREADPRGAGA